MHPDDLPPPLDWEYGAWWLYLRVQTQWRLGPLGQRTGLDYNPAIAIIRDMRWDLPRALTLLQAIERVALDPEGKDDD